MGFAKVAQCNVCERFKGAGNKWLLVRDDYGEFAIRQWSQGDAERGKFLFVCGRECLGKLQNKFLENTDVNSRAGN